MSTDSRRAIIYLQVHSKFTEATRGREKKRIQKNWYIRMSLRTTEQELHILRCQLFESFPLVFVDCAIDHVCFLFLEEDNTRFNRVLNAEASDDARASLTNAVASIRTLPLGCRIPPSIDCISRIRRNSSLRDGMTKLTDRQ